MTVSVFFVLCAYLDECMVCIGGYKAIVKLEYSRYTARIKMNGFPTVLRVVICFVILTDLTKVLLSFV